MSSFFSSLITRDWSPTSLLGSVLRQAPKYAESAPPPDLRCTGALRADADGPVEAEMQALRRIFEHFDENKDGRISRDELRRSLLMFDIHADDAELSAMIDGADCNSDGFLDFHEFSSFYYSLDESDVALLRTTNDGNSPPAMSPHEAQLLEAFRVFDKNGDGFICAEELQSVFKSMGLRQGHQLVDCRAMIHHVDADGDGQVSFDEFKQMMLVDVGQS